MYTTSTFINLTPHAVVVNGVEIPPAEGHEPARLSMDTKTVAHLNGVPITYTSIGAIEGLPAPQPNVFLIVSTVVRLATVDRPDVLSPGRLLRDDAGRVVGCGSLDCSQSAVSRLRQD